MYYERWYWVYIMTNRSKTLYTGVTGNIVHRIFQHKTGAFEGFTSRYKLDRLVYWEKFKWVQDAIAREKQLKGWTNQEGSIDCRDEPDLGGPGGGLVSGNEERAECIDPSTAPSSRKAGLRLRSG